MKRVISVAAFTLLVTACGGSDEQSTDNQPPPMNPQPPTISSFTVAPATVEVGAPAVLQWAVTGANTIQIDQALGTIPGGTIYQVRPTAAGTTVYTLTATNSGGSVTAAVTLTARVSAAPPPVPQNFSAWSAGGGNILLTWSPGPDASGYVVEVSTTPTPQFMELGTTSGDRYWFGHSNAGANQLNTYRLRATNSAGQSANAMASALSAPPPPEGPAQPVVTPSMNVTVSRGGTINFTANQQVTWTLVDGPGAGTISSTGTYVAPAAAGAYFLTARGQTTTMVPIIVQ